MVTRVLVYFFSFPSLSGLAPFLLPSARLSRALRCPSSCIHLSALSELALFLTRAHCADQLKLFNNIKLSSLLDVVLSSGSVGWSAWRGVLYV